MRSARVVGAAAALACLSFAGVARGGLFLPAEPPLAPTGNTQLFLSVLNDLRGLRNPDNPLRKQYLARVAELEEKQAHNELTADDRVNLSGYYIRLEQFEKAVAVLDPAAADPRTANFLVLSNLANANAQAGRLDRAVSYAEQALRKWPDIWPGLNRVQLYWLGRAEKYYLDLLKARYVEALRQPGRGAAPPDHPDALFGRVTFADPAVPYRAGEWPAAQMLELPNDSPLIVQQLSLWMPNDLRLQWLYAELLNALGGPENVLVARSILERLTSREAIPIRNKVILAHRQVLEEAAKAIVEMNRNPGGDPDLSVWARLLWYAQPRGATLEPGAAALAGQAGWGARAVLARRLRAANTPAPVERTPDAPEPARQGWGWLPDARQAAAVSFVAGVLVALLGVFQVREFRRRHPGTPAAPKSQA